MQKMISTFKINVKVRFINCIKESTINKVLIGRRFCSLSIYLHIQVIKEMYAASASMIGYQENSMGDLSLWTRLKCENIVSPPSIRYSILCQNLIYIRFTKYFRINYMHNKTFPLLFIQNVSWKYCKECEENKLSWKYDTIKKVKVQQTHESTKNGP